MPRCAFLSTDNLEAFFVYDDLVKPYLNQLGWSVEDVSWHHPSVNYDEYDAVIVRSTWDYQTDVDSFIRCLQRIDASSALLLNPLALMQWNISKVYLKELSEKGVPILPTLWFDAYNQSLFESAFSTFNQTEVVVKPLVSANADFTYRLTLDSLQSARSELARVFDKRGGMIQAFEPSIVEPGEFSLFYFSNRFSHAILKTPKTGDFRVQEEHGGQLKVTQPNTAMFELAQQTLNALPDVALYARIDMVETQRGYEIIETELIEPSLYFNMDAQSPERFAHAIHERFSAHSRALE